jgi:hypothetical protein
VRAATRKLMSSVTSVQVFLAMLESDLGKTETGRLQAIAVAEKEEKRMYDKNLALIKENKDLRAENERLLAELALLRAPN